MCSWVNVRTPHPFGRKLLFSGEKEIFMKICSNKFRSGAFLLGALLFAIASPVNAAYQLSLDDGLGNSVTVTVNGGPACVATGNGSCAFVATANPGQITVLSEIGSFNLNVTTGLTKPI